jgi:RimJ/RimL family protein N-acetyltransferase
VRLAPLDEADREPLFRWINDRELVTLSAAFAPVERSAHDAWFDAIRSRQDTAIFAIRLRGASRLVGSCQLHSIDPLHGTAELQIRIGERDVWGRGLGEEAVLMLLDYGYWELGLHRIHLHVLATNERALRLYERVGFRREGVLREAALIDNRRSDLVVMAKLRSDHA